MELHLDRKLSEKKIFPAIDINRSGTRREDLLVDEDTLEAITAMRRRMADNTTQNLNESIVDTLAKTQRNSDFVHVISKVFVESEKKK